MAKLSVRTVLHEAVWLAPELLRDEDYMQAWCDKYFGVALDDTLVKEAK